ncbi:MAG: hypothetical protein IRZ03_17605 [Acidobacterium ailaaui]|nr:hypothetical protein [Pseudacidobacterium ailaaui]
MKQTDLMEKFYSVLVNDEQLLRYLYYHPTNYSDDPLSPTKADVTTMPNTWDIRRNLIKKSKVVDDLNVDTNINRILVFPGKRRPQYNNYLFASQLVVIDSLVRIKDDDIDCRQSKINDRINDLVFDERIGGVGKVSFKDGDQIGAPPGFVGYRLIYEVGSVS